MKVSGILKKGKPSDIKFQEIQSFLEKEQVYSFLKNTSKLETERQEYQVSLQSGEMEKVEETLIKKYETQNPSNFNKVIFQLMDALSIEKQEGEKNSIFESTIEKGNSTRGA